MTILVVETIEIFLQSGKIAAMPVPSDLRGQIEKLDEQIITLLAERVTLCQKALEEDEAAFGAAEQAETLVQWEGAADEHGLNMSLMAAICKLVLRLCKSTEE